MNLITSSQRNYKHQKRLYFCCLKDLNYVRLKLLKVMLYLKTMSKIFIPIGAFALLVFLIVWLWQRQPTTPIKTETQQKQATQSAQSQSSSDDPLKIQNNLVVKTQKAVIKGKINPRDYFIVASNSFKKIVRANEKGDFEIEVSLGKDLNLLDYAITPKDLKKISQNSLAYFQLPDAQFKSVYAGSVKSVFDTLVTVTTPNGDVNLRTSGSSQLEIPAPEDETDTSAGTLKDIRVGDYAISLGESIDENSQTSQKLTIVRQDKPLNTSKIVLSQIITSPVKNIFTVKNLQDSKVIELITSTNTQVQLEDQNPSPTPSPKSSSKTPADSQIAKDKNSIIIYHQEGNKNVADLVYLLP